MTRRVLLGTGAVVVGAGALLTAAELTGRLDDVADAVGLEPKPLPDPADTGLVRSTARDVAVLLATVEATAAQQPALDLAPVAAVVREQLAAVEGASSAAIDVAPPPGGTAAVEALEAAFRAAAATRAADAERAGSPELVRVLASMAAGHSQSLRVVRGLR